MKRFLMVVVALMALAGCETRGAKAIEGVAATSSRFEEAFDAGDAAAVAALCTAEVVVMASNYARIRGRRAIQGFWQRFFDGDVTDMNLKTVELEVT